MSSDQNAMFFSNGPFTTTEIDARHSALFKIQSYYIVLTLTPTQLLFRQSETILQIDKISVAQHIFCAPLSLHVVYANIVHGYR